VREALAPGPRPARVEALTVHGWWQAVRLWDQPPGCVGHRGRVGDQPRVLPGHCLSHQGPRLQDANRTSSPGRAARRRSRERCRTWEQPLAQMLRQHRDHFVLGDLEAMLSEGRLDGREVPHWTKRTGQHRQPACPQIGHDWLPAGSSSAAKLSAGVPGPEECGGRPELAARAVHTAPNGKGMLGWAEVEQERWCRPRLASSASSGFTSGSGPGGQAFWSQA